MHKTTVVIPNYNGMKYLQDCLSSLKAQEHNFDIIVVDNGSKDGSCSFIREQFPEVSIFQFEENTGFCKAVNAGIEAADTEYVILLNNDTTVEKGFVSALEKVMDFYPKAFSAGAKMVDMKNPSVIDDAGDFYCALGWAFARGCGKPADKYVKVKEVFSACGGAAMYRQSILD